MAQNVTVAGASYSDVPSVTLPKTGGGTASFTDVTGTTALAADVASGKYFFTASGVLTLGTATSGGGTGGVTQDQDGYLVLSDQGGGGGGGDSWSWMGKNPTLVHAYNPIKMSFKELGADSWTWSTTATRLMTSQALSPSITMDLTKYDYYILHTYYVHYDYGNWTPTSGAIIKSVSPFCTMYSGHNSTVAAWEHDEPNEATAIYANSTRVYLYYNSGVKTLGPSTQYGLTVPGSPTFSVDSSSTATPTCTLETGSLSIRGSNSTFTSGAFSNLDLDESYCQMEFEVWKVERGSTMVSHMYSESSRLLNDGLDVTE